MNAVIYARYSSYGQTERSIEGQVSDCMSYAANNNITVIGNYIDRARSGTQAETRPEFQKMLKDAEKRQFTVVLVYKLDRFARNRYDSADCKHRLKKNGVRVVSVMENIADDPSGVLVESMLEGLAEWYSASLSENVRRGLREARKHGTFTGGYLLYGYKLDGKQVVPDETEAEAVRYVFNRYAAGDTLKDICAYLNSKGYKPRLGVKFTERSFQNALRNRKYVGVTTTRGEVVPECYPAIIDEAIFNAVQKRMDAKKHAPAASKAKVVYQLQGKLFCGMCGANMVGDSGRGKSGEVYHYYACANRKKQHTCKKHNEKKDFIEWYIVEQAVEYFTEPERARYIAARLVEEYDKEFSDGSVAVLEKKIAKADREIEDCVTNFIYAKSQAVRSALEARVDELTVLRDDLRVDLAQMKIAVGCKRYTESDVIVWLNSFKAGDPYDEDFRQGVIDAFINAVYLFDDKVVIYFNVKDGEQISYIEMCEDLENLDSISDGGDEGACSDLTHTAPPIRAISEQRFIFRVGLFGVVVNRSKKER